MSVNPAAIWSDVESIRGRVPLIHSITNLVVMQGNANALLALGAAPVMAHAPEEMEDMVALAGALVINIGTLNAEWVGAMHLAAEVANARGVPVILDPVGAGATRMRTRVVGDLLRNHQVAILRGNASEILALGGGEGGTRGVDAMAGSEQAVGSARELARRHGCAVAVSGAADYVTDGARVVRVDNGHPMLTRVTGMGCAASALVAAFRAVNPDAVSAAVHGMVVMGVAGEVAAERASGTGSMAMEFLDALSRLSENELRVRARTCELPST